MGVKTNAKVFSLSWVYLAIMLVIAAVNGQDDVATATFTLTTNTIYLPSPTVTVSPSSASNGSSRLQTESPVSIHPSNAFNESVFGGGEWPSDDKFPLNGQRIINEPLFSTIATSVIIEDSRGQLDSEAATDNSTTTAESNKTEDGYWWPFGRRSSKDGAASMGVQQTVTVTETHKTQVTYIFGQPILAPLETITSTSILTFYETATDTLVQNITIPPSMATVTAYSVLPPVTLTNEVSFWEPYTFRWTSTEAISLIQNVTMKETLTESSIFVEVVPTTLFETVTKTQFSIVPVYHCQPSVGSEDLELAGGIQELAPPPEERLPSSSSETPIIPGSGNFYANDNSSAIERTLKLVAIITAGLTKYSAPTLNENENEKSMMMKILVGGMKNSLSKIFSPSVLTSNAVPLVTTANRTLTDPSEKISVDQLVNDILSEASLVALSDVSISSISSLNDREKADLVVQVYGSLEGPLVNMLSPGQATPTSAKGSVADDWKSVSERGEHIVDALFKFKTIFK